MARGKTHRTPGARRALLDRTHDDGRLVGHRLFFGLPAGSTARGDASRSRATITELAFIPDEVPDGPCVLY